MIGFIILLEKNLYLNIYLIMKEIKEKKIVDINAKLI